MNFVVKNHYFISFIFYFFILIGCQLQEPSKNHGIVFLENRAKKLEINTSNTNDVIKIIGQPHSKSINNDKEWIYIERILTKGEYHKLGQNVLKTNNILELKFDKYGVLTDKKIYNKDDMNKVAYSNKETDNNVGQQSFVTKFLSSVRQKMYGRR